MSLAVLSSLAFFALIWLTQVMTPGPNFVRISHMALAVSRRAAMATAAGTAAGNCSWCIAAAMGAALLVQDTLARQALSLFGAAYFVWFGTRLLFRAIRGRKTMKDAEVTIVDGFSAFRAGYTTALANPQAILFFATVFITMFPKVTLDVVGIVLAIVAGVTLGWYALVTTMLATAAARRIYERVQGFIDLVFAAILWIAAIKLALR